jgi:hypothetical protein
MYAYSIYYRLTELDDPLNSDVVPLACLVTEALGGIGTRRVTLIGFFGSGRGRYNVGSRKYRISFHSIGRYSISFF